MCAEEHEGHLNKKSLAVRERKEREAAIILTLCENCLKNDAFVPTCPPRFVSEMSQQLRAHICVTSYYDLRTRCWC